MFHKALHRFHYLNWFALGSYRFVGIAHKTLITLVPSTITAVFFAVTSLLSLLDADDDAIK